MNIPIEEIIVKLDALAMDVRALKSRALNETPERRRRVDIAQASKHCNRAIRSLYKDVHFRRVPHYKHRGRLYFDLDELDAWIDGGRRKTTEEVAEERMAGNK